MQGSPGVPAVRNDGLTAEEGVVMDALGNAANAFFSLERQHPSEARDFADGIHRCQDGLAVRIARRLFPGGWPSYAENPDGIEGDEWLHRHVNFDDQLIVRAVDATICNLRQREGIGDEWDMVDDEVQVEIRDTLVRLVTGVLSGEGFTE